MGPDRDIPGPEISAGSKVMSWWFDEYSKYKGFSPACVTGERAPPHCFWGVLHTLWPFHSCATVYTCPCFVSGFSSCERRCSSQQPRLAPWEWPVARLKRISPF